MAFHLFTSIFVFRMRVSELNCGMAWPRFLFAILLALPWQLAAGAVIREEGAVYLEDFLHTPIKLSVLTDAPIYYGSSLGRYLGTLRKGQSVELQAIADHAYRVRGRAQQGQVAGWVEPGFLTPLKEEFVEKLKKNAARRAEVQELIARNEVAINMTSEEVLASLGKPQKQSARLDAAGRQETWEYLRYERVPQQVVTRDQFGRFVTQIVYVKVPVGRLSVIFAEGLVTALEQTEGTLAKDARVKIVTAPIVVR
jgi:hypothetical protein